MKPKKLVYTCALTVFIGLTLIYDLSADNDWKKDGFYAWGNPPPLERCVNSIGIKTNSQKETVCCFDVQSTSYYRCTLFKQPNYDSFARRYVCKGVKCNPRPCISVPNCGQIK